MENRVRGLTFLRSNPNQSESFFPNLKWEQTTSVPLRGKWDFQKKVNMFTIISLNSRSKCDSWNPQHIFKWHLSSQKIHTNTVSYVFSRTGTDISFCTSSFPPGADSTCACFPEMLQHNLWMSNYLWMFSSDCRWNPFFLRVSFLMIPVSALSLPSQGVITKLCVHLHAALTNPPWGCQDVKALAGSPYLATILVIRDLA